MTITLTPRPPIARCRPESARPARGAVPTTAEAADALPAGLQALDQATDWPTHRIRAFLLSNQGQPPARRG
ncbi:MAG: hypothetical protein JOY84_03925 [Curvibacter sp.]|nr:hypothetical protein [Curvibacter sp.]